MKHFLLPCLLGLSLSPALAQVTVVQSDMPSAGDTLRFSIASGAAGIDPGAGGNNQTWDFSSLQSQSQYVDDFLPVSATPFTYVATYGLLPFSSSYSDMGRLDNSAFQVPTIPGINLTISDVYNFYKSGSSSFSQKGFGASINGFPLPIPYSSSDVLVPLPLTPTSTSSSPYNFDIQIPTIGYYGREAVRNNTVDGWGTLITPFGTFQTLRIRSELVYSDTIAIDQFGFGFQLPEQTEIKYKWVAPDYGWPLLEITATTLPFVGTEVISRVVYRDKFILDNTGFANSFGPSQVLIYPNPTSDVAVVKCELPTAGTMSYAVFDATGRSLMQIDRGIQPSGTCMEILPLRALNLADGIYFLKIQHGTSRPVIRPLLVHNQ